jgi:MOSC domain-containing protein YiiM
LLRTWGHDKLGLYAKVVRNGVISTGDAAKVN